MRQSASTLIFGFLIFLSQQSASAQSESFSPPTLDSVLPAGIPETSLYRSGCFKRGEERQWDRSRPRMRVAGCANPIVTPIEELTLNNMNTRPGEDGGWVYDCVRLRTYTYNVGGIRAAMDEFLEVADSTLPTDSATDQNVACLTNTLYAWANRNGFGSINPSSTEGDLRTARSVRAWHVGTFASVYLKLPGIQQAAERAGRDARIQTWFRRMGRLILEDVRAPYSTEENRHKKNLYFWKGYSVTALAVATKNAELAAEGKRIFDIAIGQIQAGNQDPSAKGFMRYELVKRNRAHSYHIFALRPILGMLTLSKAMGCNFGDAASATRIGLLVRKIAESHRNPEVFKERTGFAQNSTAAVEPSLLILKWDAQKSRILSVANEYLSNRDMELDFRGVNALSDGYLGGNVRTLPASGQLGEIGASSQAFRKLCGR